MRMGDQIAFFCVAKTKVFLYLAIHRTGFRIKDSNPATVHRLTNNQSILGAYTLLPKKRTATYVDMLTKVQRLTLNIMPHSLMTDFKSSILTVLTQIYPDIQ